MKKACKALLMFFAMACGLFLYADSAKAATVITPTEVVTGSENVAARKYKYTVPAITGSSNAATIVPIKVSKPGELYIRINSSMLAEDVKLSLWKDAAAKSYPAAGSWDSYFYADPSEVKTGSIPISTAGTYYLRIAYSYTGKTAGTINISPYLASSADRTLKYNTWSAVAPSYNSRYTYARVNVTYNGYIGIAQQNTTGSNMTVALCNGSKNVVKEKTITPNKTFWYPVKKGTYYLRTKGTYDGISKMKYVLSGGFSASQNRVVTVPLMGSSVFDVKIKAEKTGLLTLRQYYSNSWYCTFLDSKKRAISASLWNWGGTNSVAVKKGKTYYFRINASIGDDDRVLAYSISGASAAKNTSKKKATKLKKGKKKTTLIMAGDKKWHYYKFKMTKKKKLNMSFTAEGNGNYTYQLLKGKKSLYVSVDNSKKKMTTYSKLKKGTYYIRIKMKSKSSGRFTMKLK